MKIKHLFPIVLLLTLSTFTSCELFDKADDVTFDVDVPVDFLVNVTPNSEGGYTEEKLLDTSTNPDIAEYADKIKEFKVNRITYTITNSNADGTTFDGSVSIAATGDVLSSVDNISVANTPETDLPANLDGFNDLASRLLEDKQETIMMNGQFSSSTVSFNIKLRFYITVTADAL
ncbi:MAG: hypothetical protein E6Q96_02845 [Cyclobacteriaceae bacterium]|nr:MAG: hypothetical protein E6Q96_02845 [Cyclobacteriaceae bacterium]